MDSDGAKMLLKELLFCSGRLDRTVATARTICNEEEYRQYRQRVGYILGEITLALRLLEKLCPGFDPWRPDDPATTELRDVDVTGDSRSASDKVPKEE